MQRRLGAWSNRRKIVTLLIVAVVIGGAVATGVIIKVNHDNEIARQHREETEARELAERHQAEARAEEEKEVREEQETEEALEQLDLEIGRESVQELETSITKDANSEAEEGFSEYVLETNCEAEGGRIDSTLTAQNFSCLAVTSEEEGVQSGYRYSGTINYANGTLSWRFGG
jgi:hypothetical protein